MALQRSRTDKMIAGVCGGIAKSAGWDPTLVRVLYVVISVLSAASRAARLLRALDRDAEGALGSL